ncbi:MAG: maleylpyruvate isomerase family mycothiol-dependent enzyme [Actinomycetota bacterium]
MSVTREELIGIAHAERQRLGRTIQYAPPGSWEQSSVCSGWWNRDVVAHLAGQDTAAAMLMKGDPAEEFDEYRSTLAPDAAFTVDGLNAFLVNRRSGMPYREVLTTWGQAAGSFLAFASLLSDDAWRDRRFPWLSGSIAARYLVQSRVVEWWVHGEDIRATTDLGPQFQHWPIHLTVDLGIRMLPWTLGQAGIDLSGRSVQVDLEGAGEGSWHWGLGAGEPPRPDKKPDALIQGRAPQFALVAARRLDPDVVLDAGMVVLGGDSDIAEIVLRHIRAYV